MLIVCTVESEAFVQAHLQASEHKMRQRNAPTIRHPLNHWISSMDMDKKLASGALSSFEPNDNWTKMDAFLFDILFIYLNDFENRLTDWPGRDTVDVEWLPGRPWGAVICFVLGLNGLNGAGRNFVLEFWGLWRWTKMSRLQYFAQFAKYKILKILKNS